MTRSSVQPQKNSLRTFFIFCSVVLVLVAISLSIKVFESIKGSIYNPKHTFLIGVQSKKELTMYGIAPEERNVIAVHVKTNGRDIRSGRDLGVATDTLVRVGDTPTLTFGQLLPRFFLQGGKLTWFDVMRLMLVTKGMGEKSITVPTPTSKTPASEYAQLETIFIDQGIVDENVSIGIVNATGIIGIGSRLESVITARGGNVVSVTTSQLRQKSSKIMYTGEINYTISRLEKLLQYPLTVTEEEGVSDILIVIGTDSMPTEIF